MVTGAAEQATASHRAPDRNKVRCPVSEYVSASVDLYEC